MAGNERLVAAYGALAVPNNFLLFAYKARLASNNALAPARKALLVSDKSLVLAYKLPLHPNSPLPYWSNAPGFASKELLFRNKILADKRTARGTLTPTFHEAA